jgi:putative inorganic carbon (hco3(-)) transporter
MTTWQKITLADFTPQDWKGTSYIYRLVGLFQQWRENSFLIKWGETIALIILSLLYAIAPFSSQTKDVLAPILLGCAAFWLLLTLADKNDNKAATPIHLVVLLYWSISTIAVAFSPEKMAAFKGWNKLTLYLLLFALLARILRSPKMRSWLINLYLHISLIVSVYGIRQWFFGAAQLATWVDPESPLAKTTRVYSFLGNPNLLAAYLLPAIALSVAAFFTWKRPLLKILSVVMIAANSLCLILTFSRGGWIGFIALILVLAGLLFYQYQNYLPPFWRLWGIPISIGSFLVVILLSMLFIAPFRERILSMFEGRQDSSNNFRINVWKGVQEMIKSSPIIGIGPGNDVFNKVYPIYQVNPKYSALSAYSIILEICVETGFIGLSCFLWLLLVTFNQAAIQIHRLKQLESQEIFWLIGAIAGMIALLGHGLFDTVWYRPQVNTLWWLMVALIASYYQPNNEDLEEEIAMIEE